MYMKRLAIGILACSVCLIAVSSCKDYEVNEDRFPVINETIRNDSSHEYSFKYWYGTDSGTFSLGEGEKYSCSYSFSVDNNSILNCDSLEVSCEGKAVMFYEPDIAEIDNPDGINPMNQGNYTEVRNETDGTVYISYTFIIDEKFHFVFSE